MQEHFQEFRKKIRQNKKGGHLCFVRPIFPESIPVIIPAWEPDSFCLRRNR